MFHQSSKWLLQSGLFWWTALTSWDVLTCMVHDVFHGVFTICREEEQHSIGLWAGADTTCDSFSRHEWCEGGETSSVTYRTCFMGITLYYHQDGGTPPLWTSRALRSFIACSITLNKPSWNMIRRGCPKTTYFTILLLPHIEDNVRMSLVWLIKTSLMMPALIGVDRASPTRKHSIA